MKLVSYFQNLGLFTKSFLLLIVLFFVYGLGIHFFDCVLPIHEWRKTDSLSFALNYEKGASFFSPETNFISDAGNRNAAAEFPIIYYFIGNIWRIFGHFDWIAKLISIATLFTSISLFSKVTNHFFRNQTKTLLFAGIMFSSPVLIYYSDTLLPNVYSFAFLLFASYFLFRFFTEHKNIFLACFGLFLTLALLIKITVLIAVLSFSGAAFFYFLIHEKNLFSRHLKSFLTLLSVFLIAVFATYFWYTYAIEYNSKHHSVIFSTTIRPIWEVDAARRKEIWDIIWKYQLDMLFHHYAMIPCLIVVVVLTIKKKVAPYLLWIIGIGLIGIFAYFILWFWVFDVHDYYLIEILFFPLVLIFIVINYTSTVLKSKALVVSASALFFGIIVLHAVSYTQLAFGKDNIITKNTFLVSQFVKGNWGYFHWHHGDHLKRLQDQTLEIQKIIGEKDTVLCLTDPSPNIQLYTINRIGFTSQNFPSNIDRVLRINQLCEKGTDYLLLIGPEAIDSSLMIFTKKEVYSKNNVRVYDLKGFK